MSGMKGKMKNEDENGGVRPGVPGTIAIITQEEEEVKLFCNQNVTNM